MLYLCLKLMLSFFVYLCRSGSTAAACSGSVQEDQHASDPVVPMEEDEDTRGDGEGFRVDANLLE